MKELPQRLGLDDFATLEVIELWAAGGRGGRCVTLLGILDPGGQCSEVGNKLKCDTESGECFAFGRLHGPGQKTKYQQSQ